MLSIGARTATRAFAVFVVLVGLLGMHGLAQAEVTGCHGADAMADHSALASAPLTEAMGEHAASASRASLDPSGSVKSSGAHGTVCQAVLPGTPGFAGGAFVLALVVLVLGVAVVTLRARARPRRRAPPISGVALLLRKCVCRR